jgi:hypothetical protein
MQHYDIYAEKLKLCDIKVMRHKSHLLKQRDIMTKNIMARDIMACGIAPPHHKKAYGMPHLLIGWSGHSSKRTFV